MNSNAELAKTAVQLAQLYSGERINGAPFPVISVSMRDWSLQFQFMATRS